MMQRRDFIKLSAATGALMCGPGRLALAQQGGYPGPYWLFVEARGGWDPTSFCDPKGRGNGPNGDINDYAAADIGQAGNIAYAPPPDSFLPGGAHFIGGLYSNQQFFDSHHPRLTVINGIDHDTNSHNDGRTASWSGTLTGKYPSIGALVASEVASDVPLPFVASAGASSRTLGVVPAMMLSPGNIDAIKELAFPNRIDVGNTGQYHEDSVANLIDSASAARRQRQFSQQNLLRLRDSISKLDTARGVATDSLETFVANLDNSSAPNAYVIGRGGAARRLFDQAQVAFAAFEAGAAAAAQIAFVAGFDTHADHDRDHYPRLMDYLGAVDNIIADAIARGLGENLMIVMASDFGRTNKINSDAGKDHWPHGSVMAWGGPNFFNGNRVVGATDSNHVSLPLDPNTLVLESGGVVLTPAHVHQALRNLAGIDQSPQVMARFPFSEAVLPIFT